MLRNLKDLLGYTIGAADGNIGHVKDFYFDDKSWAIRYLVVQTGVWMSSRKVLITPISIGKPDWVEKLLPVAITKDQVKNSPDFDSDKPVSRQHEIDYYGYYGYPTYWGSRGLWGGYSYPNMMLPGYGGFGLPEAERSEVEAEAAYANNLSLQDEGDPHLRSFHAVVGYHIHAVDGDIGHVKGMLVDDKTWAIRYLVVVTSNWWLGHQVLIAPGWIEDVRWPDSRVSIKMTRQAVKDAPSYDPAAQLDRELEIGLHRHYAQPDYWTDELRLETDITRE